MNYMLFKKTKKKAMRHLEHCPSTGKYFKLIGIITSTMIYNSLNICILAFALNAYQDYAPYKQELLGK